MKKLLTLIIALFFFIQIFGQEESILGKKLRIPISNETLKFYIELIEKECKINFSYNSNEIPLNDKISLDVGELTLKQVFDHLEKNHEILTNIVGDMVIIKKAKKYTISGYIKDKTSGESLIGATIYETEKFQGTSSNNYGFFSLTITEGNKKIRISYIGYTSITKDILLESDTTLSVDLKPGIGLQEISIYSTKENYKLQGSEISMERLSIKTINEIPSFGGEADVLKAIEFLPGIQLGSEASTGIIVRGGSPEQNLLLLDGIPVYNSNHAFGLFSVFNSDAIKNVTLLKGGFPARYGGRLSSVIDVRMKEGNLNEYHGNVQIGAIASKFSFEGPIVKDQSSFIISGRRTYVDIFLPKSTKIEGDIPSFFFYDLNVKINTKISDKDKLYLSAYMGHDKFHLTDNSSFEEAGMNNSEDVRLKWGNNNILLRWNHLFSKKLFSNLSILKSEYKLSIDVSELDQINNQYRFESTYYESGINDYSAKLDFDYYPTASHSIKFGAELINHLFNPGRLTNVFQNYTLSGGQRTYTPNGNLNEFSINDKIVANEFRIYVEDDFKLGEKHRINAGIHYSGFFVGSKTYLSIEPRFSYRYSLSDNVSLKAAYSRMNQYIHLLTQSSMGLPTDLWLPVTPDVNPQSSEQVTAGAFFNINETYNLEIETYYKFMNHIYAYKDGVDYLSSNNIWEKNITMGKGLSYGLEFMLRKKTGNLKGWIAYTYSKTEREFDIINEGKPYPYKYDRTHQLNIVANLRLTDKASLNSTWTYATGIAYSLANEKYASIFNIYRWNSGESEHPQIDNLTQRNNARMNSYHRMDLSYSHKKERKKTTRTWQIGFYNVYARFNPYLIYWDNDWDNMENNVAQRRLKYVALYTIIPYVSFRIDF